MKHIWLKMKIGKGDKLDEISLPNTEGKYFNLSETKGKRFC